MCSASNSSCRPQVLRRGCQPQSSSDAASVAYLGFTLDMRGFMPSRSEICRLVFESRIRGWKIGTGSLLPLTMIGSCTSQSAPHSAEGLYVSMSTRITPRPSSATILLAACISRAAKFTFAPARVYSTRFSSHPASPQKTWPVVMPIAHLSMAPALGCSSELAWSWSHAGIVSSADTTSTAELTARCSSSSCWWPGNPKAMRKRVPLSSVISRVMVPSYRWMACCVARVARCTRSRL
mmetsp:Transcript_14143/g.35267  ORF Transcript_14143/g.35267 Transcript_14143/m.35267 type:complete len:237 (+) Transcript_14143:3862-4572(+)